MFVHVLFVLGRYTGVSRGTGVHTGNTNKINTGEPVVGSREENVVDDEQPKNNL